MIEPVDRVAPFLERLAQLSVDDLAVLALPEPDGTARRALLQRALDAAENVGRGGAVREAPGRARDAIVRAFSFRGFEATWFGLNWGRSMGRAADRARLIAAIEDAAVAEVVADLIDEDDVAALREPFEIVASMVGTAPASSPIIDSTGARGKFGVAWLLGWVAVGGPAIAGVLAGIVALRRHGPRDRRG